MQFKSDVGPLELRPRIISRADAPDKECERCSSLDIKHAMQKDSFKKSRETHITLH